MGLKKKCSINLIANQLGDLFIEWKIPLYEGVKEYILPSPYFKYEMPFVIGIPIPTSSIAYEIEVEILRCVAVTSPNSEDQKEIGDVEIIKFFSGNKGIKVLLEEGFDFSVYKYLVLQIKAKNFINKDSVFFNFTYAVINPFKENTEFAIDVSAHFAYLIRSFQIYCYRYNSDTGERIGKINKVNAKRVGNKIMANIPDIPIPPAEEVDIYLTGSRLPKYLSLPRELFWTLVFIVSLLVILSPIISLIIGFLR